jgi:hypothetical protein
MKLTAIKSDGFVAIDGEGYDGIDLSPLNNEQMFGSSVRAIQWYDTFGDVEFANAQGQSTGNVRIEDFSHFNWIVDAYAARKAQVAAEKAAADVAVAQAQAEAAASQGTTESA